jgi:hypothetical protein
LTLQPSPLTLPSTIALTSKGNGYREHPATSQQLFWGGEQQGNERGTALHGIGQKRGNAKPTLLVDVLTQEDDAAEALALMQSYTT